MKNELTSEMITAAEQLILKRATGKSLEDIASEMGMTARSLYRLRQEPAFRSYYRQRSLELAEDSLDGVMAVLTERALSGNNKSIEIYLKSLGVWSDRVAVEIPTKDDRSLEAVEAEIIELKRQLEADGVVFEYKGE